MYLTYVSIIGGKGGMRYEDEGCMRPDRTHAPDSAVL